MYGHQQDDDKKKALQLQAQADQPVYGPRNPPRRGLPSRQASAAPSTKTEFAPGLRIMAPAREAQARRQIENEALASVSQDTVQRSGNRAVADALQAGAQRNAQPPSRIQAQTDQPVYGPRNPPRRGLPPAQGGQKPATRTEEENESDMAAGAAKTAAGAVAFPVHAAYDGVRNTIGEWAGGDPSQIKQYSQDSYDLMQEGMAQAAEGAAGTSEQLKAGTRSVLGIERAPAKAEPAVAAATQGKAAPAAAGQKSPVQVAESAPAPAAGPTQAGKSTQYGDQWTKTGIGQGAAGGEIVGRVGADGVPEFTNDAKAVAGAQAMPKGGFGYMGRATATPGNMTAPAGARVLASGTNVPAGDAELARTGSAANVGNGIGTFSVMGEAGDAQRAIATFERANQIRAGIPRARQLGDNGGKVTVVRDSSRAPSTTELINERRDLREREANRADRLADSRITTDGRATDRADQKQAQDMAKGDVELAAAESALATSQELDAIRQKLADPNLRPDQRAALEATYYAMTTPAKDRYMEVRGGEDENGNQRASYVFDKREGRPLSTDGAGTAPSAPPGMTYAGKTPDGKNVYRDAAGKNHVES